MEWLLVMVIGAIIGVVASYIVQNLEMPQALCVAIGVLGAIAGAVIYRISGVNLFGVWSFYLMSAVMSICTLTGGVLVYSLTSTEKRV